jgi:hypothetical protein
MLDTDEYDRSMAKCGRYVPVAAIYVERGRYKSGLVATNPYE